MSVSNKKGRDGENGVRDFMNQWFSPEEIEAGFGAMRVRSSGQNDIGDIDSVPWTCIEVKNHAGPAPSVLLDNAAWKASNSHRPIWTLVYKRAGFGLARAGYWNALTTVRGFIEGWLPIPIDTDWPPDAVSISSVEDYCATGVDIDVSLSRTLPKLTPAEFRWTARMMFRNYMMGSEAKRTADYDSIGLDLEARVVPVVVYPRIGRQVDEWYVYTSLAGFTRMLETVGIWPQIRDEYLSAEVMPEV